VDFAEAVKIQNNWRGNVDNVLAAPAVCAKIKSIGRERKKYFADWNFSGRECAYDPFLETGCRRAIANSRRSAGSSKIAGSFSIRTRSSRNCKSRNFASARNGGGENR
jgi:hypothetical protein